MRDFANILSLLIVASGISCLLTYIDDTDETYGYWEPLNYFLYGTGMQTWEYSPLYAIRTYAFIAPFWPLGWTLKFIGLSKPVIFKCLKLSLGLLTSFSHSTFLYSILNSLGVEIFQNNVVFTIFSFGIFHSGTSFLPSAVVSNLILLSFSNWIYNKFHLSILFGCVAVIWSGWPFIAVLFIPIGLHMIAHRCSHNGLHSTVSLLIVGLFTLILVITPAALIDMCFYGKRTFPPLNILLYNTLGGHGDELYGVEPVSYYIKNLFLNLGPAAIVAPLLPIIVIIMRLLKLKNNFAGYEGKIAAIYSSAAIWLVILFSRPHKEERFLYPVLPLLTFLAAVVTSASGQILTSISSKTEFKSAAIVLPSFLRAVVLVSAVCLGVSRSIACYRNYTGYQNLWQHTSEILQSGPHTEAKLLTVCMGTHWYTFPSHFFLPQNARLAFVRDAFHGQLPQPYSPLGTDADPTQPFNDENKEEMSRYVSEEDCDYAVIVIDNNREQSVTAQSFSDYIVQSVDFELLVRNNVLNAKESPSLTRAFFIPYLSDKYNRISYYALYKRKKTL